jgi:hypothetical protein
MGRPTVWAKDQALIDRICDRLREHNGSLQSLCAACDDLPSPAWIYRWLRESGEFRERYDAAREEQVDRLQMKAYSQLDELDLGHIDGDRVNAAVALARHRADVGLRLAAQVAPKKYGRQVRDVELDVGPDLRARLDAAVRRAIASPTETGDPRIAEGGRGGNSARAEGGEPISENVELLSEMKTPAGT